MLSIWDFSSFLRKACIVMNFPLRMALAASHRFWMVVFHYHLSQGIFLISLLIFSLTHWFFSSMLFSLHVVSFFSFLFLWVISSLMPLWSEKILEIISILLNLLRLALCSSIWSILWNVPCALEKNVYSDFFVCNVLKMSIKSKLPIVSFRVSVALLIICLEDLSIDVSLVLNSPTILIFP